MKTKTKVLLILIKLKQYIKGEVFQTSVMKRPALEYLSRPLKKKPTKNWGQNQPFGVNDSNIKKEVISSEHFPEIAFFFLR